MDIDDLARQARAIWGDKTMTLEEIAVALGVVYGDICREARTKQEDGIVDETALQKELGNVIFSAIRWCVELGFDPNACIAAAKTAQENYAAKFKV
ncbi:MAG TPA: hypothetical protein VIM53_04730 [Candidatus Saccharimonadales bacterium]